MTPHWKIFMAIADWHVSLWSRSEADENGRLHSDAYAGECLICLPVLAALRALGWECDDRLAAKLDAINESADNSVMM